MVTPDFEPRGRVDFRDVTRTPEDVAQATTTNTVDDVVANQGRERFFLWFWSDFQARVTITATASDLSLPDVVVSGLPTGAVIKSVVAIFKFRQIEDTSGSANDLDLAAETTAIQVKKSTGSYTDAIDMVDTMLAVAASEKGPGDVWIGNTDVKAEVDGDATYNFQLDQAEATGANLLLHDVQCGLRIEYAVA